MNSANRSVTRRMVSLGAVVLGTIMLVLGFGQTSAFASIVVHVKVASLDQSTSCPGETQANGAHFVINQIPKADAPLTVSVAFSDNSSGIADRVNNNNNESGYDVFFAPGLHVTDATAVVPNDWSGQFVLSHYICDGTPPTTTTSSAASSSAASSSAASSAASSSTPETATASASQEATSPGPIPAGVAAGRHTTNPMVLASGGALLVGGLIGVLFAARPARRRAHR